MYADDTFVAPRLPIMLLQKCLSIIIVVACIDTDN